MGGRDCADRQRPTELPVHPCAGLWVVRRRPRNPVRLRSRPRICPNLAVATGLFSGSIVGSEVSLYLRLGTPVGIGFVGEGAAFAFIGLAMGWFGATALAALEIINSFGSVIYMVPLGISIAVSVLCGQRVGRGDSGRGRAMGLTAVGVSMSWMVLCTAMVILASEWIARGLSPTIEVAGLVASLLIINAVMQIGDGIQSAALGGLRGQSDTLYPTVVTLACYGLVGVPMALVLGFSFDWGPHGLWIGYGAGLFWPVGF